MAVPRAVAVGARVFRNDRSSPDCRESEPRRLCAFDDASSPTDAPAQTDKRSRNAALSGAPSVGLALADARRIAAVRPTNPHEITIAMLPSLLLTPTQAAELLGTTPTMLIAVGVPFIPIQGRGEGRRVHRRYSRPVLLAWLEGRSATSDVVALGQVTQ